MSAPASLLAVFAHPDDEALRCGGTLALYAARGARVHLICLTRGEAGRNTDPSLGDVNLPAQREQELRSACATLGIQPPSSWATTTADAVTGCAETIPWPPSTPILAGWNVRFWR